MKICSKLLPNTQSMDIAAVSARNEVILTCNLLAIYSSALGTTTVRGRILKLESTQMYSKVMLALNKTKSCLLVLISFLLAFKHPIVSHFFQKVQRKCFNDQRRWKP